GLLGVAPVSWLGHPDFAIWTLITLAVWQFGSPMLIFLAGLRQIPAEVYEAAAIDGAGTWARFFRITLPLLSPVTFFNLVMQTITGFMVFTQAFIVTGGGPMGPTLFYALYLYRRAFEGFQMGYPSAMAWVLLLAVALGPGGLLQPSGGRGFDWGVGGWGGWGRGGGGGGGRGGPTGGRGELIRTLVYQGRVGGLGLVMLSPILWLFGSSFKGPSEVWTDVMSLVPRHFSPQNYVNGW